MELQVARADAHALGNAPIGEPGLRLCGQRLAAESG
jgi:hypothetical protein